MSIRRLLLVVSVAAATASAPAYAQAPKRLFSLDDVFALEKLSSNTPSPDGQLIAAVIQRSQTDKEVYTRDYLFGNERADVWLVPLRGGPNRNLTNGIADKSGYWGPVWSPDGARIAMLSTKGGDNVRLFVWEKSSGRITRVSDRGLDMATTITTADGRSGPIVWLDANTVVIGQLPPGKASDAFDAVLRTSRLAPPQWAKAERGEAAVSVIESGPGADTLPALEVELRAFDVSRGTSRLLGSLPYHNGSRRVQISPHGRHAAVIAAVGHVTMDETHLLGRQRNGRNRVGVLPLTGDSRVNWVADEGFFTSLGGWSPDASRFAVIGKPDEWQDLPGEDLYFVSTNATVQRATPADWRVTAVAWTADNRPVVYAQPPRPPKPAPREAKASANARKATWLRLDPGTAGVAIATSIKAAPATLTPTDSPNLFLAVADSALWSIDAASGQATNLSAQLPTKVRTIAGVPTGTRVASAAGVIVEVTDGKGKAFYRIPLQGADAPMRIAAPTDGAKLEVNIVAQQTALFSEAGRTGTFLWSVPLSAAGKPTQLLAINQQLADIADAKRILFDYRGTEGDSLKGLVILPPDYQPGKRYPTVLWVYAGSVVRDSISTLTDKNTPHSLNLLPLVSHGYALLIPSMPLTAEGIAADPYMELPKGVLTAVDKLVEMGIADPNRLGVMGQSYGGYSTYSLVTYTNRFKAAVSMAGLSDLISLYGQFDLRDRYLDTPQENLFYEMLSEGGQTRMGAPPWVDLWRYLRNSPLFYVNRVNTPLLIVGADQDYVTLTQGEQFFTALHRQGKRAKFLRYWGDEHVIESPGNVRHMWGQVFDWFDQYVARASEKPKEK